MAVCYWIPNTSFAIASSKNFETPEQLKASSDSGDSRGLFMGDEATETHEFNASVTWTGGHEGDVILEGKPLLSITSPTQWEGKPGIYSPQDLFISAIAGCYITTFATLMDRMQQPVKAHQAIGRAVLQRHPEGGWHFTDVYVTMNITVPKEAILSQVERAVSLTEKYCQVSRSLACKLHIKPNIKQED
jgi:organic hydroperoxide reductase OsmC/OhrA